MEYFNNDLANNNVLSIDESANKPIHLNVRGTIMTVSLGDFIHNEREPDNLFKKMFTGQHPISETPSNTFKDSVYYIDCKPIIFEHILEWLKFGDFDLELSNSTKRSLLNSSDMFSLNNLSKKLEESNNNSPSQKEKPKMSQLDFMNLTNLARSHKITFNLSGLDLRGLVLKKTNLEQSEILSSDFSGMNLTLAKFENSILSGSNFSNCNLTNVDFNGCDLSECNFSNAILKNTDMSNCNLSNASFENAKLEKTKLHSCKFKKTLGLNDLNLNSLDFTKSTFIDCSFKGSDLSNSNFKKTTLSNCNLENTILKNTDMSFSTLSSVSFENAKLEQTKLHSCKFEQAKGLNGLKLISLDFTESTFIECNMNGCNLTSSILSGGVTFKNCDLSFSILTKANFTDCTMSKCNLENATLKNTDMSYSSFTDVSFEKSKIEETKFQQCKFDKMKADGSNYLISLDFTKSSFIHCSFKDSDFSNSNFSITTFKYCYLENTTVTNSNFKSSQLRDEVRFSKCKFINVNFSNSIIDERNLENLTFNMCSIKLHFYKFNLKECKLIDCNLNGSIFEEIDYNDIESLLLTTSLNECIFKNCDLKLLKDLSKFKDSTFDKCKFNFEQFTNKSIENIQFTNIDVDSIILNNFELKNVQYHNCKLDSKLFIPLPSSNIVNNNVLYELIHHTNSKSSPQLLYRGSRDGFNSINFHSLCDNQGPTLTIIKSEFNQIFGGFTTQSWKSTSNGKYISDSSAFIFKIDNEQFRKFNIKQDQKQYAINTYKDNGPRFGSYDICISSGCSGNESYSNFGNTYELPDNIQPGSEKAKNYLAGTKNFNVSEIEVFKIIQ